MYLLQNYSTSLTKKMQEMYKYKNKRILWGAVRCTLQNGSPMAACAFSMYAYMTNARHATVFKHLYTVLSIAAPKSRHF